MKKLFLMCLAAGAVSFSACTNEDAGTSRETEGNDSQTKDEAAGDTQDSTANMQSSETTAYNYEAEYRDRANRMANQVSQDLGLDEETQARLRTMYYDRARQVGELETRYSSTNASAGMAADSNTEMVNPTPELSSPNYPSSYYSEIETINTGVDSNIRDVLTPEQFQKYEANRQQYYDMDMKYKTADDNKLKIDGDEAKLKVGDSKAKIDGDEAKLKSGDVKKKRDGDESKVKAGDTKIKRDGNEAKMKSGNTKIKVEE